MTPHPTTIPASLFDGALLRDWIGPCLVPGECSPFGDGCVVLAGFSPYALTGSAGVARVYCPPVKDAERCVPIENITLPLTRPECRARLCRVLAQGERCPRHTPVAGSGDALVLAALDPRVVASTLVGAALGCRICGGTGYLRRPAPAWHLVTPEEGGTLPITYAEHVPALLARHAEMVARGGKGIVGVMAAWHLNERLSLKSSPNDHHSAVASLLSNRWTFATIDGMKRGPEMGDAGKAAADAAALAAGYAVLDNAGALTLPPLTEEIKT